MNDDFIYVNKSSLSSEFCKDIIMKYEDDKEKYPGATGMGVDKNVKDTTDLFRKRIVLQRQRLRM